MYLTKLTLDMRQRAARRDLANPYQLHRTLSRAFADSADAQPDRFLWRQEMSTVLADRAIILVQSELEGRWNELGENGGGIIKVEQQSYSPAALLCSSGRFRFRLRANATVSREGRRWGVQGEAEQHDWLLRQLNKAGAEVLMTERTRDERWELNKRGTPITLQIVQFDGILRVLDADSLVSATRNGIGPAKAFGLGLLSLAALQE